MNETVFKDIGLNIVFHRKLRGMNQVLCARQTGISIANMSKIERGLAVENVPLATYIKIAEVLNVSLMDLLKPTEVRVKSICVTRKL